MCKENEEELELEKYDYLFKTFWWKDQFYSRDWEVSGSDTWEINLLQHKGIYTVVSNRLFVLFPSIGLSHGNEC